MLHAEFGAYRTDYRSVDSEKRAEYRAEIRAERPDLALDFSEVTENCDHGAHVNTLDLLWLYYNLWLSVQSCVIRGR